MGLSELSPFPVFIDWEGQEIQLKPFDLRSVTWAERFFALENTGGFERMNAILRDTKNQAPLQNAVVEITHYLAGDQFSKIKTFEKRFRPAKRTLKERFYAFIGLRLAEEKPGGIESYMAESGYISTAEILKEEIRNHKNKVNIFNGFIEAIHQTFENSFPKPEEKEEHTGGAIFQSIIAKEEKARSEISVNWAQIYTKFFTAGGMTIEQFYSLTMKQVSVIGEELGYHNAEAFRDMALANGIAPKRIKIPKRKEKIDFTADDVAKFEKMHEKLMKGNGIN
jgi:hypothetical protein